MSDVSKQLPTEPISAVGVVASFSKVPDGYFVVSIPFEQERIICLETNSLV